MSYSKKIAFSTVSQFIGKILSTAISLVTFATLYRALGVEGIGKYTTVFAYVAFFAVFADFGLQWFLIRELSVTPKEKDKIFQNVLAFRTLLALAVFLIAFLIVWLFHYPVDVKWAVGLISLGWFFTMLNSAYVAVYLNNYRMDIATISDVIGRLLTMALVILIARSGYGFIYLMSAYLAGNLINLIISRSFVHPYIKVGYKFDFNYWRYTTSQSFAIGIVLVFGFIYYKIDSLMLSWMKDMTDVGIYGSAYKLLEVLVTLPSMFLGAAFPLITKYIAEKDSRITGAFQKQFDILAILAFPLVAGTLVLADKIIIFIAGARGNEFISAVTVYFAGRPINSAVVLQVLIFAVGCHFFSGLYNYMLISLGKQKSMIWPTISFAVFNILINLLLIPYFSYLGAAVSTVVTELIVLISYKSIVDKNIKLPLDLRNAFKVLIASVLMFFILHFLVNRLTILPLIAIGMLSYLSFVIIFKALPKGIIKKLSVN